MNNIYIETFFSTCGNVTTAQIILKDNDDIDVLCSTDSSPK